MISLTAIKSYIQGTQFQNPRLYDVLIAIVDRLQSDRIYIQELQSQITIAAEAVSYTVLNVDAGGYTLLPDYIQLVWGRPEYEGYETVVNFELRKGTDWDTATRLIITNTTSAIFPPDTVGTHTYLVKAIGTSGNYCPSAFAIVVLIPEILAPSLTSSVIDNNVLLFWSAPASPFRITHYKLTRNGTDVGTKDGTFTTYFEQIAGTYSYGISAVDVAGIVGAEAVRDIM